MLPIIAIAAAAFKLVATGYWLQHCFCGQFSNA